MPDSKYPEEPKIEAVLYKNDYKEPGSKQPDRRGKITMTRPFLKALVEKARDGAQEIEIELAGWDRVARPPKEQNYIFMRLEIARKRREEAQPPAAEDTDIPDIPF